MTAEDAWRELQAHRDKAAQVILPILVWGPKDDGSPEYAARRAIRDALLEDGHSAEFSEDLCRQVGALKDPLDDETLQAMSAKVIIMIYGSRGSQTERDMILTIPAIAAKSMVLVEDSLYEIIRTRSVANQSWETMSRNAVIIRYNTAELLSDVVPKVRALVDDFRKAYYVRSLKAQALL